MKLFWLHVFDKKRPSMVSNYIIPSESEMLSILAENSGVSVVWDINAKPYLKSNTLQLVWDSAKMPETEVYFIYRKNNKVSDIIIDVTNFLSNYIK